MKTPYIVTNLQAVLARNRGNLLFVLLLVVIILQVVQFMQFRNGNSQTVISAVPLASTTPVEIFTSQTATIRGKVTAVNGASLAVQNDQKITGNFEAGKVVLINDLNNLLVASNSSQLQKIQLNKDAIVNLLYTNGRYVVTSLTYR